MQNEWSIPLPYQCLRKVFHHKELAQHRQLYFFNRQYKLSALMEDDRVGYLPLNNANTQLVNYCKRMLDQWVVGRTGNTRLHQILNSWQQAPPYDSYRYASQFVSGLKEERVNISEKIAAEPHILSAFVNVPSGIRSFFQYNFVIDETYLSEWLSEAVNYWVDRPEMAYHIRELTIHREILQTEDVRYRLLRLKLLPEKIVSKTDHVLADFSKSFTSDILNRTSKTEINISFYAEQLASNIFLSQGNTGYKELLKMLGIIHNVYHADHNFAYVK